MDDRKHLFNCPNCKGELWIINEKSVGRGDKPTIAKCEKCDFKVHL